MQSEEKKGNGEVTESGNTRSYFSALSSMVSYAASEWSFAQLRLEQDSQIDEMSELAARVCGSKVYALTSKGFFISTTLTAEGGSLNAELSE